MKKLIIALLAMTLILTAFVACSGNDSDNASSTNNTPSTDKIVEAIKPNDSSSVQSLTSDELDAWGDVSIGFESEDDTSSNETTSGGENTSSDGTVTSDASSGSATSTDSTSSTGNSATSTNSSTTSSKNNTTTSSKNNNSASSDPKDLGFFPWKPTR